MAGFKTHIATSTAVGIGYGAAGHLILHVPLPTCVLSAGLCSIAGILPDLDSGSGVPVRETIALAAAVIPILMLDRFDQIGLSHESMVLVGVSLYLMVRFGVGEIFKRYTVHRGMWHSIPAALSAGLFAFLICSCEDMTTRLFKASAVVAGFLTHLLLDEFWSVEMRRGRMRLKKSAGTALKLWSRNSWANISTYGKLAALIALAFSDPIVMSHYEQHRHEIPNIASQWFEQSVDQNPTMLR